MHKQCTLPAARWGHKEKVKWRVLCLQISKSHESERSCTILDLGGQGRHKHDDPAQLHNIFIQGCWNTLGMYKQLREYAVHADYAHFCEYADAVENFIHINHILLAKNSDFLGQLWVKDGSTFFAR